jgi:hypothetical protein
LLPGVGVVPGGQAGVQLVELPTVQGGGTLEPGVVIVPLGWTAPPDVAVPFALGMVPLAGASGVWLEFGMVEGTGVCAGIVEGVGVDCTGVCVGIADCAKAVADSASVRAAPARRAFIVCFLPLCLGDERGAGVLFPGTRARNAAAWRA